MKLFVNIISQYSDVTLLDKLSTCNDQLISRDEIIVTGKYGIDCIEIGGPKPGVGCAGRGIIRGINAIEQAGILQANYDLIIYDILGNVILILCKQTNDIFIVVGLSL
ncbi:MAG: hypothetical protein KBT46_03695 [Ruminococcus sp.]|nr:hypothetical protein [Candidatus Copronaster equi]